MNRFATLIVASLATLACVAASGDTQARAADGPAADASARYNVVCREGCGLLARNLSARDAAAVRDAHILKTGHRTHTPGGLGARPVDGELLRPVGRSE